MYPNRSTNTIQGHARIPQNQITMVNRGANMEALSRNRSSISARAGLAPNLTRRSAPQSHSLTLNDGSSLQITPDGVQPTRFNPSIPQAHQQPPPRTSFPSNPTQKTFNERKYIHTPSEQPSNQFSQSSFHQGPQSVPSQDQHFSHSNQQFPQQNKQFPRQSQSSNQFSQPNNHFSHQSNQFPQQSAQPNHQSSRQQQFQSEYSSHQAMHNLHNMPTNHHGHGDFNAHEQYDGMPYDGMPYEVESEQDQYHEGELSMSTPSYNPGYVLKDENVPRIPPPEQRGLGVAGRAFQSFPDEAAMDAPLDHHAAESSKRRSSRAEPRHEEAGRSKSRRSKGRSGDRRNGGEEADPSDVKSILDNMKLKGLTNPLLNKSQNSEAPGTAKVSELFMSAIRDTASKLIEDYGLGKSLEILNAGGSAGGAGGSGVVEKKKSMSPIKITANVGPSRRKKSDRRSRSVSPKPTRRSKERSSRRSRSRSRERRSKRHHHRSHDRHRQRSRQKTGSASDSPSEETLDQKIKSRYPKLAATLAAGEESLQQPSPQATVPLQAWQTASSGLLPPPVPLQQTLSYPAPIPTVNSIYQPWSTGPLPPPMPLPFNNAPVSAAPVYTPIPTEGMLPMPEPEQPAPVPVTGPMPNKGKKTSNEQVEQLRCTPCNLNFKTKKPLLDHIETNLHKKRFKAYVTDSNSRKKVKAFPCEACQLVFSSVMQLANHKLGEIHQSVQSKSYSGQKAAAQVPTTPVKPDVTITAQSVAEAQIAAAVSKKAAAELVQQNIRDEQEFAKTFCYECRTKFNAVADLTAHKAGKKHASKVIDLEETPHPPPQQFCHVCNMWFPNATQLVKHETLLLHTRTLKIFKKFTIPIPGVDYTVNPRRNLTVVIEDDAATPAQAIPAQAIPAIGTTAVCPVNISTPLGLPGTGTFVVPPPPGPISRNKAHTKKAEAALSRIQAYNDSESEEEEKVSTPEPAPPGTGEETLKKPSLKGKSDFRRSRSKERRQRRRKHLRHGRRRSSSSSSSSSDSDRRKRRHRSRSPIKRLSPARNSPSKSSRSNRSPIRFPGSDRSSRRGRSRSPKRRSPAKSSSSKSSKRDGSPVIKEKEQSPSKSSENTGDTKKYGYFMKSDKFSIQPETKTIITKSLRQQELEAKKSGPEVPSLESPTPKTIGPQQQPVKKIGLNIKSKEKPKKDEVEKAVIEISDDDSPTEVPSSSKTIPNPAEALDPEQPDVNPSNSELNMDSVADEMNILDFEFDVNEKPEEHTVVDKPIQGTPTEPSEHTEKTVESEITPKSDCRGTTEEIVDTPAENLPLATAEASPASVDASVSVVDTLSASVEKLSEAVEAASVGERLPQVLEIPSTADLETSPENVGVPSGCAELKQQTVESSSADVEIVSETVAASSADVNKAPDILEVPSKTDLEIIEVSSACVENVTPKTASVDNVDVEMSPEVVEVPTTEVEKPPQVVEAPPTYVEKAPAAVDASVDVEMSHEELTTEIEEPSEVVEVPTTSVEEASPAVDVEMSPEVVEVPTSNVEESPAVVKSSVDVEMSEEAEKPAEVVEISSTNVEEASKVVKPSVDVEVSQEVPATDLEDPSQIVEISSTNAEEAPTVVESSVDVEKPSATAVPSSATIENTSVALPAAVKSDVSDTEKATVPDTNKDAPQSQIEGKDPTIEASAEFIEPQLKTPTAKRGRGRGRGRGKGRGRGARSSPRSSPRNPKPVIELVKEDLPNVTTPQLGKLEDKDQPLADAQLPTQSIADNSPDAVMEKTGPVKVVEDKKQVPETESSKTDNVDNQLSESTDTEKIESMKDMANSSEIIDSANKIQSSVDEVAKDEVVVEKPSTRRSSRRTRASAPSPKTPARRTRSTRDSLASVSKNAAKPAVAETPIIASEKSKTDAITEVAVEGSDKVNPDSQIEEVIMASEELKSDAQVDVPVTAPERPKSDDEIKVDAKASEEPKSDENVNETEMVEKTKPISLAEGSVANDDIPLDREASSIEPPTETKQADGTMPEMPKAMESEVLEKVVEVSVEDNDQSKKSTAKIDEKPVDVPITEAEADSLDKPLSPELMTKEVEKAPVVTATVTDSSCTKKPVVEGPTETCSKVTPSNTSSAQLSEDVMAMTHPDYEVDFSLSDTENVDVNTEFDSPAKSSLYDKLSDAEGDLAEPPPTPIIYDVLSGSDDEITITHAKITEKSPPEPKEKDKASVTPPKPKPVQTVSKSVPVPPTQPVPKKTSPVIILKKKANEVSPSSAKNISNTSNKPASTSLKELVLKKKEAIAAKILTSGTPAAAAATKPGASSPTVSTTKKVTTIIKSKPPGTKRPLPVTKIYDQSTAGENVAKSPATKSPAAKSSVNKSPANKSPAAKSSVNKSPTNKSPANKQVVVKGKTVANKAPTSSPRVTSSKPEPPKTPVTAQTAAGTPKTKTFKRKPITGPDGPSHEPKITKILGPYAGWSAERGGFRGKSRGFGRGRANAHVRGRGSFRGRVRGRGRGKVWNNDIDDIDGEEYRPSESFGGPDIRRVVATSDPPMPTHTGPQIKRVVSVPPGMSRSFSTAAERKVMAVQDSRQPLLDNPSGQHPRMMVTLGQQYRGGGGGDRLPHIQGMEIYGNQYFCPACQHYENTPYSARAHAQSCFYY